MKIKFAKLLNIFLLSLMPLVFSGCQFYYPTSFKAFVPSFLDPDYYEYKRLCKQEAGKVVYAEPMPEVDKLREATTDEYAAYMLNNNVDAYLGAVGYRVVEEAKCSKCLPDYDDKYIYIFTLQALYTTRIGVQD